MRGYGHSILFRKKPSGPYIEDDPLAFGMLAKLGEQLDEGRDHDC